MGSIDPEVTYRIKEIQLKTIVLDDSIYIVTFDMTSPEGLVDGPIRTLGISETTGFIWLKTSNQGSLTGWVQQTGAGATPSTGLVILSVQDFGASSNPAADSTAGFQAALNAAAAAGTQLVYVPPVNILAGQGYRISSTVTIPPNVILFGVGANSLVFNRVASGDVVFQFASGLNRSGIQNMQIVGVSGAPAGHAISFVGSQYNFAKNMQVWYQEIGIDLSDGVTPFSAYNIVEQCEVNVSTEVGIRTAQHSNSNAVIGGRVFYSRNVGNTAIALQIDSARALSLSGGLALEDYDVGLQIGGAPSFSMTGCWFEKGATLPLGADFEVLSTFSESAFFEGGILFDGNHHADPWPLSNGVWNARMWGVLPSNADNSAALQAVIDYAADPDHGGVVYIPTGSYSFATALTNPACIPIICAGELVFTGSGEHAITFGQLGSNTDSPSTIQSVINVRRATQDWTDAFAGLRLLNVDELQLMVSAEDFECGLLLQGVDTGVSYNQIQVQRLFGNRVGVRFHAVGTGWSNENIINGGRYSSLQATSSALNMHGIEFVCDSNVSRPNGNKIIGPSIELHNVGAGYTSAVHGAFSVGTIAAQNNVVENARIESTDYWLSGRGVINNLFSINYLGPNEGISADLINADTPDDFLVLVQNIFDTNLALFGSSEPVRVAGFDRTNVVAVGANIYRPARGVVWNRSTNSIASVTTGTLDGDSMTIASTSGIGIALDLRNVTRDYTRKLTLKSEVRTAGGRMFAVCWDSSFTRLTSSDACSLGFNAGVGYYRTGSDMSADQAETVVTFGESVAFALVGVASGTASADISSFDVFALGLADIRPVVGSALLDLLSAVPPGGIAQIDIGDPISNAIPDVPGVLTTYPVGQQCRNVLAAANVVQGWVYTGTTWVTLPTTLTINSDPLIGSAAFASFTGDTFAPTAARRMQIGSTGGTDTVAYDLAVTDGSRNPRCRFFLTNAVAGSGGWGFWFTFGSSGLQPFVVGYTNETPMLRLAPGTASTSNLRGGAAVTTGTGGGLTVEGGPGGPSGGGGGGGRLDLLGGTATDGPGGDVLVSGRDAVTNTATSRPGGNTIMRAGLPTVSGVPGRIQVNWSVTKDAIISPAALGATQDNWNPTSLQVSNVIRILPAGGGTTLTGIVAGISGQILELWNISAVDNLVLAHDATSTAANRFLCPNNANFTIRPNGGVRIWYDITSTRYRVQAP